MEAVFEDKNGILVLSEDHEQGAHSNCDVIAEHTSGIDEHVVESHVNVENIVECANCREPRAIHQYHTIVILLHLVVQGGDVYQVTLVREVQVEVVWDCVVVYWVHLIHWRIFPCIQFLQRVFLYDIGRVY